MKVKFSFIDNPIELNKKINLLKINNSILFDRFFYSMRNDFNDSVLIVENSKELDLKKYCLFINGIFDLNINSKKNLSLLYAEETKSLSIAEKDGFEKINKEVIFLLESIKTKSFYDLDYDFDILPKNIFETFNLRFSTDSENDFSNYLDSYIDICSKLMNIKVIITYDLLRLLKEDEIESLNEILKRSEICLLDISFGGESMKNNHVFIEHIDADFSQY